MKSSPEIWIWQNYADYGNISIGICILTLTPFTCFVHMKKKTTTSHERNFRGNLSTRQSVRRFWKNRLRPLHPWPLKINMDHNSLEVWKRSLSFLNWWFVAFMLIFQGVSIVFVALFHLKSSSKNICSRIPESQMMVDGNHGEPLLNTPNGDFFGDPKKGRKKQNPM